VHRLLLRRQIARPCFASAVNVLCTLAHPYCAFPKRLQAVRALLALAPRLDGLSGASISQADAIFHTPSSSPVYYLPCYNSRSLRGIATTTSFAPRQGNWPHPTRPIRRAGFGLATPRLFAAVANLFLRTIRRRGQSQLASAHFGSRRIIQHPARAVSSQPRRRIVLDGTAPMIGPGFLAIPPPGHKPEDTVSCSLIDRFLFTATIMAWDPRMSTSEAFVNIDGFL